MRQGQSLPSEHDEVSSQSSSSTKILSDGAAHAHIAEVILSKRERGSKSVPDEPSSVRDSASASIVAFQEKTKMEISLPKKAKVRAVAVSPSPLQVAVLCKHSVHLYSMIDGGETKRDVELSKKVDWKKIRLASHFFAIYGLGLLNEKQASRIVNPCYHPNLDNFAKANKQRLKFSIGKHCAQRPLPRTTLKRSKIYFYLTKGWLHISTGDL